MSQSKNKKATKTDIGALQKKIAALEAENAKLKDKVDAKGVRQPVPKRHFWRTTGSVFFVTLSIVTFMLFNISSWVKNTALDTDTFVATVQPVLKQPEVQQTLQNEITDKIFANIDIEAKLNEALPENVAFIAGPLSAQVEGFVNTKIGEVLASDKAYDVWGQALETAHSTLINYLQNDSADGTLSVNELYAYVGSQVNEDRKIAFLFNKQLPEKVGSINIAELSWVPQARSYVNILEKTPIVFLLISLVSLVLALLLAVDKRKVGYGYIILSLIMTTATLAAIQLGSYTLKTEVQAEYADVATSIYNVLTSALGERTSGYLAVFASVLILLIISTRNRYIVKIRKSSDAFLQREADAYIPQTNTPEWLVWIADNSKNVIWIVFITVFVLAGVRIPPNADMVISGFITGAVFALIVYLATVVVKALKRK